MKKILLFLAVFMTVFACGYASAAEEPEIFVQTGHATPVNFLAVDKNERYLVSIEDAMGGKYLKIWEISSGKEIRTIKIPYSAKDVYFTGSEKFAVVFGGETQRRSKTKFVVVSGGYIETYNIHGEKIEKIDLPANVNGKTFITKNGEFFYTIDALNNVHFYDIKDGSEIKVPEADEFNRLVSLGFGFSGVFFVNEKGKLQYVIYDENLKLRSKGIFKDIVSGGKIDPNSKFFYTDHTGRNLEEKTSTFSLYSLDTGELLCSINRREPISGRELFHFSVLPDGRIIFDYSTWAAKLGTGENKKLSVIKILDNCMYKEKNYTLDNVTSYVFSNTYPGFLIHGHDNGNVKMLDLNTGTEIKSFGVKPVIFESTYSVDDKLLNMKTEFSIEEKRSTLTFNLWNIKEGKLEKSESSSTGIYKKKIYDKDIKGEMEKLSLSDPDVYYSKIPKNFLKNDYKKDKKYDHISQGHIFIFESKNRNYSVRNEGPALVLYNPSTKSEIAKLYAFTDGEWVVITPEGYFNASPNGAKHLNVRIGNNVYGVDQYLEKFYRPEVVIAALAGKPITGLASLESVKPAPSVSIVETPASVDSDETTVKVKVADQGGGIGDVRLYLNGSAVVLDRTRNLAVAEVQGQAQVFSYKVRLVSGKNSVRAIAFNAGNSMQSTDALHEIEASIAAKKPSLHALIIGIQDYENPKLTLKYPVADAKLMAATLRERAAGLFERVNVVELTTKAQTTKDAITQTLKEMSEKVSPNDLFVFFVASHGTLDDREYFLITSNVGSVSTAGLKQNALSQDDLKAMIANVPATKKLVFIDTCNAGKLGEAIQAAMLTRGMNEETALKILSRAVGSTILSASSSVQEALEGYEGHGLFTYVVVEGLKGRADFNKDGSVNTLELATFVDDQVPKLAEQVFKHKQYPMNLPTGYGFPVVMVK